MFSKLAVALLVVACVAAAAGGAYVATRQNEPAAATAAPLQGPAPAAALHDTEAIVSPAPEAAPPSAAPDAELEHAAPLREAPALESRRFSPAPRRVAPAQAARPPSAPLAPDAGAGRDPGQAGTPQRRPEAMSPNPDPQVARTETAAATTDPARADTVHADPPPPAREFVELEVPASAVVGLRIETPVSTETAHIEDRVDARVMRDVVVGGRAAIPAGTRALGAVTIVERGGKVKERARLGVRFHTLVLADGTQVPIRTDAIIREGESPAGDSARKIGGAAVGGAILGALMGGKKGAIVGSATGAAGGTAVVMAGDRQAATLPAGAVVTLRLSAPVAVEVERD